MTNRYQIFLRAKPQSVITFADSEDDAVREALERANHQFEELVAEWECIDVRMLKDCGPP